LAKVSGEVTTVASGAEVIWRGANVSGLEIVWRPANISGVLVLAKISGDTVVSKVSGEVAVVASGAEVIWRTGNLSGLVVLANVSGQSMTIGSPIDADYDAVITVDIVHHMIHDGNYYGASSLQSDVNTISGVVIHMITPADATRIHWDALVESDVAGKVELWENTIVSVSGSVLTVLNRNRDSTNTTECLMFKNPGYTSGNGTILQTRWMGVNNNATKMGGSIRPTAERILKSGTNYLLKFTPLSSPNNVYLGMEWYEVG
jgi:hypothetical protein